MKNTVILWLRISFWAGAIVDVIAALLMLFPALFVFMNRPADFEVNAAYRYAMGMGAPLMLGWTVLLLWADRKPIERKDVLPITLLVVIGEIVLQVWGIVNGFVPFFAMAPSFVMQTILIVLFLFSYLKARNLQ